MFTPHRGRGEEEGKGRLVFQANKPTRKDSGGGKRRGRGLDDDYATS